MKNQVQLIGNIGNAPVVQITESGKKLARFSVATNESKKNKEGEWETLTTWHQVVAWGPTADLVEKKAGKGLEVAISGKLNQRNYTSKEGEKKLVTEIVARNLMIVSKNNKPGRPF